MNRPLLPKNARKRDDALHKRAIVREAFDKIRNIPAKKETVALLARALGGSVKITSKIISTAERELNNE